MDADFGGDILWNTHKYGESGNLWVVKFGGISGYRAKQGGSWKDSTADLQDEEEICEQLQEKDLSS